MSIFRKDNLIVIVKREPNEPIEQFIERGNYIANRQPKTEPEYQRSVLCSKVYANVKFLGCEYGADIMRQVNEHKS